MGRPRQLVKKILPDRLLRWLRRRRAAILRVAGASKVTPVTLLKYVWHKAAPIRAWFRRAAKRILPRSFQDRLRRRRVMRRYLKALSYELLERETRLDYIEGRVAARRDGFYERIVKDVLERTEIILQELDRRIEGLSARSGERLEAVEEQLFQLQDEIGRLRQLSDPGLGDVTARARAEVPEVPTAEDEVGGEADDRAEREPEREEPEKGSAGNGSVRSGAAATMAE